MELNVFERINLLSILPGEGNFLTLKIMRKLRESLSFTEEENKALQFNYLDGGRVSWDSKAAEKCIRDFEFTDVQLDIIKRELKQLDGQNRLKDEHFTLYEKFIGNE